MAAGDPLPDSFPPMGAEFEKPYMEFEYKGKIYRVENLAGGHNGAVAAACKASPPQWDEQRKRWVVPVSNNLIEIDFASQPQVAALFPADSPLRSLSIANNPRRSYTSQGFLVTSSDDPSDRPRYPLDCEFNMYIRIVVPGRWSLINTRPFRLVAKGLLDWPPPVGTVYKNEDTVELFPEWLPFAETFAAPLVRILPGDETIIRSVIDKSGFVQPSPSGIQRVKSFINRIT